MNPKSLIPSFAALTILASGTSQAAIIISDSFDDGGRTNGTDANDAAWYYTAPTSAGIVTGGTSVVNGNNSLAYTSGGNFRGVEANFADTTLASFGAADSGIRFTFDFKLNSTNANTNGFRFGIFNSLGTPFNGDDQTTGANNADTRNDEGFISRTAIGGTAATMNIGEDRSQANGSGSGPFGSDFTIANGTNFSLNSTTQVYSGLYEIVRDSATTIQITASIYSGAGSSGSPIGTVTQSNYTLGAQSPSLTFNSLGVGLGAQSNNFAIDNVILQTIPEPSSAALLLGALGAIAIVRRRK